jgi:hypothetical protein
MPSHITPETVTRADQRVYIRARLAGISPHIIALCSAGGVKRRDLERKIDTGRLDDSGSGSHMIENTSN